MTTCIFYIPQALFNKTYPWMSFKKKNNKSQQNHMLLLQLHCNFSFLLCSRSLLTSWNLHWFSMQHRSVCFIVQPRPLLKTGTAVMCFWLDAKRLQPWWIIKSDSLMCGFSGIANCGPSWEWHRAKSGNWWLEWRVRFMSTCFLMRKCPCVT